MYLEIRIKTATGDIKVLKLWNSDLRSLVTTVEDIFGLKWYSFKILDHNHKVIYDGTTDPSDLTGDLYVLSSLADIKNLNDITFRLAPTGTLVYAIDNGPMLFHGRGDTLKRVRFEREDDEVEVFVREINDGEDGDNLDDIVGNIMRIPEANKITIYNWGSFPYQGCFYLNHFRNIEIKTDGAPDLFLVTSPEKCFQYVQNFKGFENLAHWDVSNVTNMGAMFFDSQFTGTLEPISNWNVSNVANMAHMFYGSKLTGTLDPIFNWNVSNVANMARMFCMSQLTGTIDELAKWNVSNVTNMSYMFYNSKFTGTIDALLQWNVSNVTNMSYMFTVSKFTGTIEALARWNVRNVTNMSYMFYKSQFTGTLDALAQWDVGNVTDMGNMFYNSKFTGGIAPLSKWAKQPPEF